MSPKTSKKATTSGPKPPEPIITRTKSAQQRRQLRNKGKKTEKPKLTKPEIKSPKTNRSVICMKESLLKNPVKKSVEVIEQAEYYPNKLKRNISTKKIMLKPKHNFKVIASTNKRKLATPQKGIKSPIPKKQKSSRSLLKSQKKSKITTKPRSSPELSMQDMVRIMEETGSLSDEDFMEILTCPSPVWWEDPPDWRYDEDSIYTRSSDSPLEKTNKETKNRKITMKAPSTKTNNNLSNTEQNSKQKEQLKVTENKKNERFDKKKQKLENILGNIKKTIKSTDEIKNKALEVDRNRKCSDSEGDISDLSFNEEELLKNLENMDIPVEKTIKIESDTDSVKIKKEIKNEQIVIEIPPLQIKSEIKDEFSIKSSVYDVDSICDTNMQSSSDVSLKETSSNMDTNSDNFIIVDSCTNSNLERNEDSDSFKGVDYSCNAENVNKSPKEQLDLNINEAISKVGNPNDFFPDKKVIKDLSEYITVYKIIPQKNKSANNAETDLKPSENTKKTKLDTVRGKLDDFFKQCKNKRLKNTENPVPAIPVIDVKEEATDNEKENGDKIVDSEEEKNRLKPCDYCIENTENGIMDFSCEKCENAPILPCVLCNFVADTKEIYIKHVSTCKDVARISWNHNYVLNQT